MKQVIMGKRWIGKVPEICDVCKRDLNWVGNKQWFVDGATSGGPWAFMCPRCFEHYGVGLGTGKGQKYDVNTMVKLEG